MNAQRTRTTQRPHLLTLGAFLLVVGVVFPVSLSFAEEGTERSIPAPRNASGGWTDARSAGDEEGYVAVLIWDCPIVEYRYDGEEGEYCNFGYIVKRDGVQIDIIDPSNPENHDVDYERANNLNAGAFYFDPVERGISYQYSVVAFDHAGNLSAPASITVKVFPKEENNCEISPNLSVSIQEKTVELSWPEFCDAQEYEIWRELVDEPETGPFSTKESLVKLVSGLTNEQRTYTDTVDEPGWYLYTVIGYQVLSGTPSDGLPPALLPPAAMNLLGIGVAYAQESKVSPKEGETGRAEAKVDLTGEEADESGAGTEAELPGTTGSEVSGTNLAAKCGQFIKPGADLAENLKRIYNCSIPIIYLIAFLMVIVAGYIYITSLGNPERIKLAKEILVTTLIGVAFLLMIPSLMKALGLDQRSSGPGSGTGGIPEETTGPFDFGEEVPAEPIDEDPGAIIDPAPVPEFQLPS